MTRRRTGQPRRLGLRGGADLARRASANGSIVTSSPSRAQTPAITPSTSSTGENQPPGR